jgi:uncharacterized Zn finger protein
MAKCPDCRQDETRQHYLTEGQKDRIEAAGTIPESDWFRCNYCGAVLAFRDRGVIKVGDLDSMAGQGWRHV